MANSARDRVLIALEEYEGALLRYAQRLLRDQELARDVVQDVFLKLCKNIDKIGESKIKSWLYTVCRNRALDIIRREKRREDWNEPDTNAGTDQGPAQLAENTDLHELLLRLIDELPNTLGESLQLWAAGLSYREIANVTERRENSVRVQVHRGLQKIREHPEVCSLTTPVTTETTR